MKHRLHAAVAQRRPCLWAWVLSPVLLFICGAAVFAQAKEPAVVQKISYTAAEGSGQVVIFPSHEVTHRLFALPPDPAKELPARFYVDLSLARLGREVPRRLLAGEAGVRQVRTAQFNATTVRVVLDVEGVENCQVFTLADPYRLVVEVKEGSQTSMAKPQDKLDALQQLGIHTTTAYPDPSPEEPEVVGLLPREGISKPAEEESRPLSSLQPSGEEEEESMPQPSRERVSERTEEEPVRSLSQLTEDEGQGTPQPHTASREEGEAVTLGDAITLEEAYNLALSSEEQIKIAERELAKARLLPWRAVAIMTPRASITGSYRREKDDIAFSPPEGFESVFGGNSEIRPKQSWQGLFTTVQPLFDPTFLPSWRLGKDSVKRSENQYKFTTREVLFGVARAYYDVLRGQELDEVSFQTLKLALDELRMAQVRFRVGEVTKTDVLRAEVAVERARRALVENDNQVELSFKILARSIGVAEPLQVRAPAQLPSAQGAYEELLQQAYKQREDLRAQEFTVRVAKQRKNLVLARYSPSIQTQWQYPRLERPTFAQPDEFWTLLLNFEMPLFDGGNREIDLLEAAENLTEARLRYDQLRKDISVEVRRAFLAVQTLETTLETLRKEVSLAQENYGIISKQYRVGLATILDVNTSLLSLNQARTEFTNQSYAYQVALLNLQRAVGTFGEEYVFRR